MIETKEFTFAESKEEALWIKAKDATEKRLKQYPERIREFEEAILIDTAFLELCKSKIKNDERKNKI